jgi:ABC-2 type transport system ATP-binding protein
VSVATIQNLTVRYRNFTALQNFSCVVEEGCTGLLGPNGAGKSTLIKTLLGFITPVTGSGEIYGHNIATDGLRIRQLVGFMPEQDCHIPGMSAVQFVAYAGELAGMPGDQALRRAHEVLEYCGLGEARYRNVETYSTGMKQRIKLAQAIVHGPSLLLLDEPTNGLDPAGREEMLDLIRSITHGKGISVIVSSHILPDIERVCDRVIVVMKGELRAQGTIAELKQLEGHPVDVELREASTVFADNAQRAGLQLLFVERNSYRFQGKGLPSEAQKELFKIARESQVQIRGFKLAERSLEDAFLNVLGESDRHQHTPPPPVASPRTPNEVAN